MFSHTTSNLLSAHKYSEVIHVLDNIVNDEGKHLGYLLDGGFLGNTYLCPPLSGASMKLLTSLDSLFRREYAENSFLQISLVASDNISDQLDAYHQIRGQRMKDVGELDMDEQGAHAAEFLKKLTRTTLPGPNMDGVPLRHFEVWVTIKNPIKKQVPTQSEIETFVEQTNQLQETLNQLMGYAISAEPEIFLHRMQMIHNPSKDAVWRKGVKVKGRQGCYRPTQPIKHQYLEIGSTLEVKPSSLVFKNADGTERHVKSISIQEYAENANFGDLHELVVDWIGGKSALQGNFTINLNVEFAKAKIEKVYGAKRTVAKQIGEGPWARWISSLKYGLQDFEYYEHYMNAEKAQHCRYHLNFQVMASSEERLEKTTRNLITRIDARGWKAIEDKNIMLLTWLSSLPLGPNTNIADFIERYDILPSNLLKFFVPMMASWRGNTTQKPVMTFVGRDAQLMMFDPFTSETNYNLFITATSGSGKSFFANNLIEGLLSTGNIKLLGDCKDRFNSPVYDEYSQDKPYDGGRVFAIDSGRSYAKLAELVGGQFVEVIPNELFTYNLCPFKTIEEDFINEYDSNDGLVSSERSPIGPQGEMLLNILKLMAFPMGECSSYQFSQMSVIMCRVWSENGTGGSIDIFADLCAEHEDKRIKEISDQLTPWCRSRKGQHGWMFNQNKPSIQFEKSFVVLELDALNGSDQVKAVAIMLCIQRIQQEMFSHEESKASIRKMFLLDEAWELLKDDKSADVLTREVLKTLAKFLESGWRRFRKYNSLGCCISQSIRDATESPAGIAMASNSAHMMYLRQNEEELQAFKAEGRFSNQTDFKLLESVHTNPPYYSEVLIKTNGSQEIGRLYLSRAKGLSYSTNPVDKNRINNVMAQGKTLFEACRIIAIEEGHESEGEEE